MKHLRERLLMAAVLIGLPTLVLGVGILPAVRESRALRAQIQAANEEFKTLPQFTPLTQAEREALGAPDAPWRSRMPLVVGDRARLAHYHRVVGDLQGVLKSGGISPRGIRSSWDPIRASFSVPSGMDADRVAFSGSQDAPEMKVNGWVLEMEIPGGTDQLFKALGLVHRAGPLLEPAGLRWEATPDYREQRLLLRNLVLVP